MRHAESAVWLSQMLMLLVLPVGSNQSNLALALDILALISMRLTLLGFCCLTSQFMKNCFSIASGYVYFFKMWDDAPTSFKLSYFL